MLQRQPHPEHAYRACLGLLSLSKRYGNARLEAACTLALSLGTCKYTHIRDILLNRRDLLQASTPAAWTAPAHAHERGAKHCWHHAQAGDLTAVIEFMAQCVRVGR